MLEHKDATKQAQRNRQAHPGNGGTVLPAGFEAHPERRHNGAWKKEDTLRYKWEKIIQMNEEELHEILKDPKIGRVEKMTAEVLLDQAMKPTEKITILDKLATQVYGFPKQEVTQTNIELKPILPKKAKK